MIHKVVPHRQGNPRVLADHRSRISRLVDDLKLVARTDPAPQQDLGRPECAGREDGASALSQLDDARVAPISEGLDLDAGNARPLADNPLNSGAGPELEVAALASGRQVCGQGPATLAARVHVGGMGVGVVFGVGRVVGDDGLPPGGLEAARQDVEALLQIEPPVGGRVVGARDAGEDAGGCGGHVFSLPAAGEVVVPIDGMRLWRKGGR